MLNLSNVIRVEDFQFIRRIGKKTEQQEARPVKVGVIYQYKKEMIMEVAKNLNKIPNLRHISIGHDLMEIQRRGEASLWKKACEQNLAPSKEMTDRGLVMKVVGPRGQRRILATPLRWTEGVDEEGRVRTRGMRREGARSREQERGKLRDGAPATVATGANLEPLGRRKRGNDQGAAAISSREQQETSRATQEEARLLRPGQVMQRAERWSQSSGSGEEGMERRKGRQELAPRSLPNYSGVRREEVRSSSFQVPRFSTLPASLGLAEVMLQ